MSPLSFSPRGNEFALNHTVQSADVCWLVNMWDGVLGQPVPSVCYLK